MQIFDTLIILILIHSLVMGFYKGGFFTLLRLVKYVSVYLFITFILPSLTHSLIQFLGLYKTIYVYLQKQVSFLDDGTIYSLASFSDFPVTEVREKILYLIQEFHLSLRFGDFLLSFLEGEEVVSFLERIFSIYSSSQFHLWELALVIFSHISAFYGIFLILAIFSFFTITLIWETFLPLPDDEGFCLSSFIKIPAALLNFSLTILLLAFLFQILTPLLEFFSMDFSESVILKYTQLLLYFFEDWYLKLYLA